MSHKDMIFSDQVRLIQLVVGVPVTGETSNTNAQAMTALTGISGANLWKMSTEQFMDEVGTRMNSDPDFKAQVLNNISDVSNPQHQALLGSFANGVGVSLAAANTQTQQQTQQAPIVPPPPGTGTDTTATADPDALRLEAIIAANNPTVSPDNTDGLTDAETTAHVDRTKSLVDNIVAQEREARENASLSDLTRLMGGDLSQGGFVHAIQAFLSALGFNVDLTGVMNDQTAEAANEAHAFLEQRDDLIAEIAEHANTDLRVNMASTANGEPGIAITVQNHTMTFGKDAITAHGGSFNDLILNSPDALIALEASKGADATTILLDAAGLSLADVQAAIEGAPDSAEKTEFLERINNTSVAPNPAPVTYDFGRNTRDELHAIVIHDASDNIVSTSILRDEMLESPATNSDDITAFLDIAANDPAILEQAIGAIITVLGDDPAKIEAVRDAYTGGNADVTGELNEAILLAPPTNTQTNTGQLDPAEFFIPITNTAQGIFEIMGQDPANGQDIAVIGIDPAVFSDPAAFTEEISAYIDVAAQNNGVLNTTMTMLTMVTGGNPDHLKAIQSAYNGGNPMVVGAFNSTIQQAETAAAATNTQNNASPISYDLVPDMQNNEYLITKIDTNGEQAIAALPISAISDPAANGADITAFLDAAANDPDVLGRAVNAIHVVLSATPEKLADVQSAYTGNNQAVSEALDAIVGPASAEPTAAAPAPDAAVTTGETRRGDRGGVTTADASTIPFIEDAADVVADNSEYLIGPAGGLMLGHLADQATGRREYRNATRAHVEAMTAFDTEMDAFQDAAMEQNDYDNETREQAETNGRESASRTAHTIIPQQDAAPSRFQRTLNATSRLVMPTRAAQADISDIARTRMGQAHADTIPERTVRLDGDANGSYDLNDGGRQTLGFAYQDTADQIAERAQPSRARNWMNNNLPLVGDRLTQRSEQRTARLVEHGESEVNDIDRQIDESFEADAQQSVDDRNTARPDVPESPTHPGDAPNHRDFNRNRYGIKGAVIGAGITVALAATIASAAPANAQELGALSEEALVHAQNGDFAQAGIALRANASGAMAEFFERHERSSPEQIVKIGEALAANAMGEVDTAGELLNEAGLDGDSIQAILENRWDHFALNQAEDLAVSTYEGTTTVLTQGLYDGVVFPVAESVTIYGWNFFDLPSLEEIFMPHKVAFEEGLPEIRSLASSLSQLDVPAEMSGSNTQFTLLAETIAKMDAQQVEIDRLMADEGGRGMGRVISVRDDLRKDAQDIYRDMNNDGSIMELMAFVSAMEHGSSQPAPDATPAPSPDTAVGAFAEVAAVEQTGAEMGFTDAEPEAIVTSENTATTPAYKSAPIG